MKTSKIISNYETIWRAFQRYAARVIIDQLVTSFDDVPKELTLDFKRPMIRYIVNSKAIFLLLVKRPRQV